jgi:hypothetical protein
MQIKKSGKATQTVTSEWIALFYSAPGGRTFHCIMKNKIEPNDPLFDTFQKTLYNKLNKNKE